MIQKIKKISYKTNGFTLVELIIVITILAILATIAFISFKSYSGNARDGNKLTTLSNIETGLSLYQVKTGNYPTPDTIYGSGNYSGTLLSQVGFVGSGVIQVINMNTIPKDPIVDFEYTYGLSNDKRYYQLGAVLENNETSLVPQTYANNYTSKVVGNYKGLYKFKTTDDISYIINLPSLIFTQTGEVNFQTATNPNFVVNKGGNLVKPYDDGNNEEVTTILEKLTGNSVTLTGVEIPSTENWNTQSGSLKESLGYEVDEIWNEATGNTPTPQNNSTPSTPVTYASCNLNGTTVEHGTSVIAYETSSVTFGNACTSEQRSCNDGVLSGSFTSGSCSVAGATGTFTLSSTSTQTGQPITITDNCSLAPTSYTSSNTNVGTISGTLVLAVNPGTTTITPVGGACGDTEGKTLTVTAPPVIPWKDIAGTHCENDDYVFTQSGVTYRWAGCNSVLGTGVEWGTSNAYCSNYTGDIAACGTTQMTSTSKENAWNSTYGTNNIWGKLYTQEEAKSGACPSGWHLPSDVEWTTLENYLNGSICRTGIGTQCPGLGWYRDNTKNATNNVVEALKIPLAGLHNITSSFYANRGENAFLWSNETISNEMHTRLFTWSETGIQSQPYPDNYAFSVRCVKN